MKRKMKRFLGILLSPGLVLVMILTLLPGITMTAYAADVVSYVYYTQNGNTAIRHTDGSQSTYTTVTGSTTSWSNGWYVVNSNVTVSNRISVTGTVYLILCDGYKLTASAGITVTGNNHLVIYGQDAGTGALQATGSNGYSGIGGDPRQGESSQFMEETLTHIAAVGPLESEVAMEKKEEQLPYMVEL